MKRRLFILKILFSLSLCFLVGCTGLFLPSQKDAKLCFERLYKDISVLEFKKVGGKREEKDGINYFELYFEAKIQYNIDLVVQNLDSNKLGVNRDRYVYKGIFIKSSKNVFGEGIHRKGDVQDIKGMIKFMKTKSGWQSMGLD